MKTPGEWWIHVVASPVVILLTAACGSGSSDSPKAAAPAVCSPCRTFVTAATFTGDLKTAGGKATGIAGADHLCQVDAAKPASGTFKAMLVDGVNRIACTTTNCSGGSSEHVDWVFRANTTYYRANGTTAVLTTGAAGIWNFGSASGGNLLTNPFDLAGPAYFTGLDWNWTVISGQLCGGSWANGTHGVIADFGNGDRSDASAIGGGANYCDLVNHLLCVEQ